MNLKKLTISAMLVAVAVILSSFSIPIGPSRCFPIQHLCNVLAAVFLGPVYGVSMAFCTALIRNLLGTGSLLAFPGSMVGAFVSAMIFKYTRSKIGAYLGEVIGTGILGGMRLTSTDARIKRDRIHDDGTESSFIYICRAIPCKYALWDCDRSCDHYSIV